MKVWQDIYCKISTLENIFLGWEEFRKNKKGKKDVLFFERYLENNLFKIYELLKNKTYIPGGYTHFYIRDPKLRIIHKASVLDRVIHHIVSQELEVIFEPTFYAHSYSCRKERGTHKGVLALRKMAFAVSKNNTRPCWALKCDIKKFFASINHEILTEILGRKIKDEDYLKLLTKIVDSFYSDRTTDLFNRKGVPIGNLTSQHFANIYLNELDQFIKHTLKVKYYLRYADDFILLSPNKTHLEELVEPIQHFLKEKLDLELHEDKIILRKFTRGIDFLGYVVFPYCILPRTKTKKRMFRKIKQKVIEYKEDLISFDKLNQTVQSYIGYLGHADSYKLKKRLNKQIQIWLDEEI